MVGPTVVPSHRASKSDAPPFIGKDPVFWERYRSSIVLTSAARTAFSHLLKSVRLAPDAKVLLPSYIGFSPNEGSGVLDPIRSAGLPVAFYRLNANLAPDLEDFERQIKSGSIGVALVIHYFGFCQSHVAAMSAACRNLGILLVEDCAHSLTSTIGGRPLGSFADASIFSVHKVLAAPDGGFLQINNPAIDVALAPDSARISRESLEILHCSDLARISEARRANYLALRDRLERMAGLEILFPTLQPGIVPHNFPIRLLNKNRHDVFTAMMDQGVRPVALYYRLIDEIRREDFPEAHDLSDRILNLPVHQDLSVEQMARVADVLAGALS